MVVCVLGIHICVAALYNIVDYFADVAPLALTWRPIQTILQNKSSWLTRYRLFCLEKMPSYIDVEVCHRLHTTVGNHP